MSSVRSVCGNGAQREVFSMVYRLVKYVIIQISFVTMVMRLADNVNMHAWDTKGHVRE